MTVEQITEKARLESIKFETAKQIRQLLDEAREQYGANEWDNEDIETEISELVFEE